MVAEDIGAKRKIEKLLSDRDETLQDVKKTLQGLFCFFFPPLPFFLFFSPLSCGGWGPEFKSCSNLLKILILIRTIEYHGRRGGYR